MTTLFRSLTSGSLAIAGAAAVLGFGGVAQAAVMGTGAFGDNATISGTTNPSIVFADSATFNGTGQFAGGSLVPNTFANPLLLTGSGPYSNGLVNSFFKVNAPGAPPSVGGPGVVTVNLLPFSSWSLATSGLNYAISGNFIPVEFVEPDGITKIAGSITLTLNSNSTPGGGTSQSYSLSFNKLGVEIPTGVPEPSAVLGMLALGLTGVLVRRQKG